MYDGVVPLSDIRAGKTPQQPSDGTVDPIWRLLEECWSRHHWRRPSATRVYDTLSKFRTTEELPEKFELRVQSIRISFAGVRRQRFYVKLKYRNEVHMTSLTTRSAADDEYIWFAIPHPYPCYCC